MGIENTKERFEVLDIFRGLFASMVIFYHLAPFADTWLLNNPLIKHSDLFVDFFFVLSGFVIAYKYSNLNTNTTFSNFLKRRFYRLYPLHIIMLLVFLCIEFSKHFLVGYVRINELNNPDNNPLTFAWSILMLNSVKLPGVHDVSWNIPSWSVSAEMIAYLFFGLLTVFLHQTTLTKQRNLFYLIIICGTLGLIYLITDSGKLNYTYDYGFLRGIIGFFTGTLCQSAYLAIKERLKKRSSAFFNGGELLCVLLNVLMIYHGESLANKGVVFEILFFATILIFAFEQGIISRTLKKSSFLNKMGHRSYSIYLIHALFISLFNVLFIRILKFPPTAYSYLFIVNYLVIFIAAGWTYKNIEQRFMLKRKARPEES